MKNTLLIILLSFSIAVQAQPDDDPFVITDSTFEEIQFVPIFQTLSTFTQSASEVNSKFNVNQAAYHFKFTNLLPEDIGAIVRYSIDSVEFWQPLENGSFSVYTTPGSHSFQIYINENYLEALSPVLEAPEQTEVTYNVTMSRRPIEQQIITFKPVIYLYPKEKTEVEVEVDIHAGKDPFFYPKYSDKWSCVAHPNGTLEMDQGKFRYLFWEAVQADHLNEIQVDAGYVVSGSEAVDFLEEKLTKVGFTSEERADFITFWGPKLAANAQNLVRFEWNEVCDKFADLNISPKPDHTYRFYIFMSALDTEMSIEPQELPAFQRDGFVVLEWGGQVSNYQINTAL